MSKCLPVILYRCSRRLSLCRIPLLPAFINYATRVIFGCWLPSGVRSGRGLLLGYQGLGVVVHHDAVLGENVHIDQHVTIGGKFTERGVPVIGDRVYIGAGAKILGPIRVGDDVIIGANAVVISDVPNAAVVVGVPARILPGLKQPSEIFQ